MSDKSLYERLGGVFAIAAVVDHFSDAVVRNAIAGQGSDNPALREWHTARARATAGPEVHAHAVGVRCRRRAVRLRGHQAGP